VRAPVRAPVRVCVILSRRCFQFGGGPERAELITRRKLEDLDRLLELPEHGVLAALLPLSPRPFVLVVSRPPRSSRGVDGVRTRRAPGESQAVKRDSILTFNSLFPPVSPFLSSFLPLQ